MINQFFQQQVPSVRLFDEKSSICTNLDFIDLIEISPETNARIAKHTGESGKVYADTRVVMPARYRAVIAFPEQDADPSGNDDAYRNLLDASYKKPCKYALTSLFTRGYNFMVVSSRNRDTTDMTGLRLQDVVFEECLVYDPVDGSDALISKTDLAGSSYENMSSPVATPQVVN